MMNSLLKRLAYGSLSALKSRHHNIVYVTEGGQWVIDEEGRQIFQHLKGLGKFRISNHIHGFQDSLFHFGSKHVCFPSAWKNIGPSNRFGFTWYHGSPVDSAAFDSLQAASVQAQFVHTSCHLSKDKLVAAGVDPKKITVIPLGVDTQTFRPPTPAERQQARQVLGITDDTLAIGSFQKDGQGWGEGLEPKLEKGPDILVDVLKRVAAKRKLVALLSGPSRGYVKKHLADAGVPHIHKIFSTPTALVPWYWASDIVLITGRDEGGPKALLEGWATGSTVVSSDVGMAHDLLSNGINGYLSHSDDVMGLSDVLEGSYETNSNMREAGRMAAMNLSYHLVAKTHWRLLYSPWHEINA